MPGYYFKLSTSEFRWKPVIRLLLLILLPLLILAAHKHHIFIREVSAADKPNVVLIIADDMPDDSLNFMPKTEDKLEKNGVYFKRAYVTTGLCCPSRASILTGLYTHNHGVLNNFAPLGGVTKFKPMDNDTLPVWLKKAGYKTMLIGKYMNEYDKVAPYIPPGWDRWFAFNDDNGKYFKYFITTNSDKAVYYGTEAEEYSTDVFAAEAVNFIKQANEPFFLYFAPHSPHGVPRPAPRHENNCKNAPLRKTDNYNEADISDKPAWVRKNKKLSQAQIREDQQNYELRMCTLLAFDDAVMDIIGALGNKLDNTIIIFISDNGFLFGEHRMDSDKDCFYEECNAVDMIISYPKITQGKKSTNQFALNIDLAPTILDLIGEDIPDKIDGKSLAPLLKGEDKVIHDRFLIESYNKDDKGEDFGIRVERYKYQLLSTGEEELYDMEFDPYELNNLAGKLPYAQVQDVLSKLLKAAVQNEPPPPLPGILDPVDPDTYNNDEDYLKRPSDKSKYIEGVDSINDKCITDDGKDGSVTEVGCIPREPVGFAGKLYRIGLGVIGGLVLLFIIIGGFLMLTSEEKPARLNSGKKFILYAIIGLVLAIFGYIFLEVIAVDILHLPGFSH
jgi:N-acetylglucosamine-6-sulfatase